jgi:hypothetical protein
VGAADGDLSFEVPALPECDVVWWLPPCVVPPTLLDDDVPLLACVDVIPGSATASPAVARTLAVVAEMATAFTRARPRLLAAMSARGSLLLGFMASRMACVVRARRRATSEPPLKTVTRRWSGTVRP